MFVFTLLSSGMYAKNALPEKRNCEDSLARLVCSNGYNSIEQLSNAIVNKINFNHSPDTINVSPVYVFLYLLKNVNINYCDSISIDSINSALEKKFNRRYAKAAKNLVNLNIDAESIHIVKTDTVLQEDSTSVKAGVKIMTLYLFVEDKNKKRVQIVVHDIILICQRWYVVNPSILFINW